MAYRYSKYGYKKRGYKKAGKKKTKVVVKTYYR